MTTKADISTVSCPCGATIQVDLNEASVETVCPECGMTLEVVVSRDPKSGAKRVGILVKSASVAPRRGGKPKTAGGGRVEEEHTAKCTCGAQLTIIPKSADDIFVCDACDAQYTASLKQPRSGGVPTLVLRPLMAMPVAPKGGRTTKRTQSKQADPETPAPYKFKKVAAPPPTPNVAARENLLMLAKGQLGAAEIEEGGGGSMVFCFCGKVLPLRGDYHREIHKCPSCAKSWRIFSAAHPRSGAAMAIMIPR